MIETYKTLFDDLIMLSTIVAVIVVIVAMKLCYRHVTSLSSCKEIASLIM